MRKWNAYQIRNGIFIFIATVVSMAGISSCSKSSGSGNNCVSCSAVCPGNTLDSMSYCGDGWQAQEEQFKTANAGCTISCNR